MNATCLLLLLRICLHMIHSNLDKSIIKIGADTYREVKWGPKGEAKKLNGNVLTLQGW